MLLRTGSTTLSWPTSTESQPPLTVFQPITTVAQPPLNVSQPITTGSQPPLTVSQPIPTGSQPPLTVSQPIPTGSQPPLTVSQLIPTGSQPPLTVSQLTAIGLQPTLTVLSPSPQSPAASSGSLCRLSTPAFNNPSPSWYNTSAMPEEAYSGNEYLDHQQVMRISRMSTSRKTLHHS